MSSKAKVPTIRGQLITCGLLCTLSLAIVLVGHSEPKLTAFVVGLPLWQQVVISFAFAACTVGATSIVLAIPRLRLAIPIPQGVQAIDLSGTKPVQIGLAAGVGEELLFRAALQPLAGCRETSTHRRGHRRSQSLTA